MGIGGETWRRYTAVGNKITGVAAALGGTEKPIIYDAFDCPSCGCQIVVNERLRRVDDN
jgi:DNA-directed RNA polymerase subunit RPC12/RpoP